MYSVSLLPYEYRLINTKARKKNISLILAMVAMGLLFATYIILTVILTSKNAKLNEIRKEATSVESQISKIDDLLVISNEVNRMLNDASVAAGSNPEWSSLITSIGNSVPESVSLKNIGMEFTSSDGECNILGTGLTHQSVSEWLRELEKVSGIGEILCVISTIDNMDDVTNPVRFEITIPLKKGPGYKLPMEVTGNE